MIDMYRVDMPSEKTIGRVDVRGYMNNPVLMIEDKVRSVPIGRVNKIEYRNNGELFAGNIEFAGTEDAKRAQKVMEEYPGLFRLEAMVAVTFVRNEGRTINPDLSASSIVVNTAKLLAIYIGRPIPSDHSYGRDEDILKEKMKGGKDDG